MYSFLFKFKCMNFFYNFWQRILFNIILALGITVATKKPKFDLKMPNFLFKPQKTYKDIKIEIDKICYIKPQFANTSNFPIE